MASRITRRDALQQASVAALAAPFVFKAHVKAAPSETLYHASFGAAGMAGSDIRSLTSHKNLQLVAVAEVDTERTATIRKQFPKVRVYQDWRELLDKEKNLSSCNISTPDHMHAPITMRAMQQGLHVYTQKPLTQTIYEARQLAKVAADNKLVSQMGIQIHSHAVHRTVVATIQQGAIGKVREVHSWSGKQWSDPNPLPKRRDPVPAGLNWDWWLGVAEDRPYLKGYYHPFVWRKRLDFGTGTFGDMGCHILDPVATSLALTAPKSVQALSGLPYEASWGKDVQVQYVFPGTKHTTDELTLNWYDGNNRPPKNVQALTKAKKLHNQGSIYIGEKGVLYSPYIATPVLLPSKQFEDYNLPNPGANNHYHQFVEACLGNGKTSAPFSYSGPLTEWVLLGCLSTRFPKEKLEWNAEKLQFTNNRKANSFVRREYRKGWEVKGL